LGTLGSNGELCSIWNRQLKSPGAIFDSKDLPPLWLIAATILDRKIEIAGKESLT
jgi:hypothetical protein